MYICICNQVTEAQLQAEMERGANTVRKLRESVGVTNQCGKCGTCVKACVKEHKQQMRSDMLINNACSA
jgi:bacterioferritin-associated ferredoxin